MRIVIAIVSILVLSGWTAAQDGSDMGYYAPNEITADLVGRRVHIDFYRDSGWRGRIEPEWNRPLDTVRLKVRGKQIDFLEHRQDDGFNNWFQEQYLESADKKLRITEFELLGIGKASIKVRATLNPGPFNEEFTFNKKDIAQVLVKSNR